MITNKLDELAELYAQRDLTMLDKQKLLDEILTAEIKARMADIEAEFSGKSEIVNEKILKLESEIKDAVKQEGTSIKGQFIHAVFSKGRISWDTKILDGLMIALPELSQARKEGEPSVSLRKI